MAYLRAVRIWLALSAIISLAACASQPDPEWKVHSAFAASLPGIGATSVGVVDEINLRSNGALTLERFEPGQIASGYLYLDELDKGSVQAAYGNPVAHIGKNAAFEYFSTIPFGDFETHYDWLREGGGQALMDEIYARYGVKSLPCGAIGSEGAGWFNDPIDDPKDLQGLRMRFFGIGAKVMAELGAVPVLMPGAQIRADLQSGKIGATEFNTPHVDEAMGFFEFAKFYYYPSWHQPYTIHEFAIQLELWDGLSQDAQGTIQTVCHESVIAAIETDRRLSNDALDRYRSQDIAVQPLPSSIWNAAERAWEQVRAEAFIESPDAKRVYESYQAYAGSRS